MCGSSPRPDPAIGQAALQNAQLSREMADVGREELAFQREQWNQMQPYYTQMLQDSLKDAAANRERSTDAWNFYQDTFRPIEQRYAQEAQTYDSPEETARREGAAAATVQRQIDNSRGQVRREAGRMGLSADRSAAAILDDANAMGLAKAGAINKERGDTKLLGMQLRQDAANFGRGQTQIGLATGAAALQGQGAAQSAITNQAGNRAAGIQAGLAPMQSAVGANNSAANIYNQIYQGQVAQAGQTGQAIGTGLGAATAVAAVM